MPLQTHEDDNVMKTNNLIHFGNNRLAKVRYIFLLRKIICVFFRGKVLPYEFYLGFHIIVPTFE
jgi:hypothetical protein